MQRHRMVALFALLSLAFSIMTAAAWAQEATEEPVTSEQTEEPAMEETEEPVAEETEEPETTTADESTTTYIVKAGDTLYRIAINFGLTTEELAAANNIENARQIFVGQVLVIPIKGDAVETATEEPVSEATEEPTVEATPEATAEPTEEEATGTYTVKAGDTLNSIAQSFGTTAAELAALNGIENSNVIFVGQVLNVPGGDAVQQPVETEPPQVEAAETPEPSMEVDPGFDFGITVFVAGQNVEQLAAQVDQLGMNWVKVPVDWSALEPSQGQIDFSGLRAAVDAMDATGANIMLTVTSAPEWAREVSGDIIENGPPADLATFESFMTALATEFSGTVDAYQIWEEPNLRRNWRCDGSDGRPAMCNTDYMDLLRIANDAVGAADSDALVVTAGLAPTRFNDRVNAIDDRVYLKTLVASGADDIADAIGVHPGGFANPPDAVCCEPNAGVETHFEDSSFYFQENLTGYRDILVEEGAENTPMWVTRFGWGTSEDTDPPSNIHIYVSYTGLGEQAIFVPRAFALGEELGYIGVMFLDNLNGCTINTSRTEICYTSLLDPTGEPRPVFNAVQGMAADAAEEPTDTDSDMGEADATEEASS